MGMFSRKSAENTEPPACSAARFVTYIRWSRAGRASQVKLAELHRFAVGLVAEDKGSPSE